MDLQYFNIQNIFLIILTIIVIFLVFQNFKLQKKFKRIFIGSDNNSLEKVISSQIEKSISLEKETERIKNDILIIKKNSKKMIQKVKIKRYNPFKEIGSDQSFTISFLDANNNGLLLTGLHSQDAVRVYAKTIENGTSKYKLSYEEQEILTKQIQ